MNAELFERAKQQADICKIFGSTTRILILWALGGHEMSVSAIAETIDTSLQNASQHLRLMQDRGLLTSRREGHSNYYRVNGHELMRDCAILRQALQDPLHK